MNKTYISIIIVLNIIVNHIKFMNILWYNHIINTYIQFIYIYKIYKIYIIWVALYLKWFIYKVCIGIVFSTCKLYIKDIVTYRIKFSYIYIE